MNKAFIHRFIPNSAPETRNHMLNKVGISDIEEIYQEIPENCRFRGELNIQKEPLSE